MTEETLVYDELSLRIEPGPESHYRIVVSGPDGSTASGTFALPFGETELDNFVLRVGRQRRGTRGFRSAQMEEAKQFGAQLFEALMIDDVRDVFRSARGVADSHRKGLRITLYLTDVPELMGVPWEFLYERPRFLAQSMYSPVVRSLDLGEVRSPHAVRLPLRVLGMVSCPQGVAALDVELEKEKLTKALAPLCEREMVTLEWLDRGSLSELDEVISRRDEVHVLHYVGHGAYDSRTDSGILILENERGEPHEVTGEELGSLLQDEHSLRLAVFNSCEGARSSHVDPFSGVASSLVHYGIPAVIGMQFEITDEAAIAFAARLYTSLAEGYPVDAALAQARKSIFAAGNDIEFGTPVLFLRGTDAQLFELENAVSPEVEAKIDPLPLGDGLGPPEQRGPARSAEPSAQPPPPPPPPPTPTPPVPPTPTPSSPSSASRPRHQKSSLSTRRIAVASALLFTLGCVLAVIFEENSAGSGLGGLAVIAGFGGLCWASIKALLERRKRRSGRGV